MSRFAGWITVGDEVRYTDDDLESHIVTVRELNPKERKAYVEFEDSTCDWVHISELEER